MGKNKLNVTLQHLCIPYKLNVKLSVSLPRRALRSCSIVNAVQCTPLQTP